MKNQNSTKKPAADTPRFLVTESELEYLIDALVSSLDCNSTGGGLCETPEAALNKWAKGRAKWIDRHVKNPNLPMPRSQAKEEFSAFEEEAAMLRGLLVRRGNPDPDGIRRFTVAFTAEQARRIEFAAAEWGWPVEAEIADGAISNSYAVLDCIEEDEKEAHRTEAARLNGASKEKSEAGAAA